MYLKKSLFILFLFLLVFSSLFAQENIEEKIVEDMPEINLEYDKIVAIPNGPTYIKNFSRKMKSPGYWISKLENPDEIILTLQEIENKNKEIYNKGLWITDILNYPKTIKKSSFQRQINTIFRIFKREPYLNNSLKVITKKEINDLKNNAKLSIIKNSLRTKYAITTNYTDVRLLPTEESFISSKETFDIDRSQVAGLDIGEPIVVISQTKDKKWAYIVSCIAEGWIKTDDFAYTDFNTVSNWINKKNFVIVTKTKTDIFLDEKMCKYHDYVRMGTKFPLIKENEKIYCIEIPKTDKQRKLSFDKAYILKEDANKGFLPYTQRNILNLAFTHLNSPYSWGGQNGEQDCSTFIRQIFGCFGFVLPRNSSSQIKCGIHPVIINKKDSVEEKNNKIIDNAVEAISFLALPGHIMLYIGKENNTPYIIHAIWGTENYKDKTKTVSFINKIIVSDLFIGKDTSKGSLIERMTNLSILK